MERGKVMEAEARDYYLFARPADFMHVGFVRGDDVGCSPDGLVGTKGALEIKTTEPHLLADILLKDEFPEQHKAQTQGVLWVAEREWIDLVVYWPKMPVFIKRAYRDEEYIANLAGAVRLFNEELAATVDQLKGYGKQREAA